VGSKPREKSSQALEAGEIGCGRGNLECPPLDHRVDSEHYRPLALAHHDPIAAGQQEPEIRADEDVARRSMINPIDALPGATAPHPGTESLSCARLG
jgi:hypothetical protein